MKGTGRWVTAAVLSLLLVMVGEIVHAVRGESLTWDEGNHIFAGYESWKAHDYGLNPEHPPMVKMLATLPLLGLDLKVPPLQGRFFKTESYMDGRELLFRNGPENGGRYGSETLVIRARMFAMLFTILTGLLVFSAGREMFGTEAGLLGLVLFCFEPTLLAHGAYVTTDMAASCTIFGTVYAFWRWIKRRTWGRLAVVGVAAGLGLAAKHSAVLLAPMLLMLGLGEIAARWWSARKHSDAADTVTRDQGMARSREDGTARGLESAALRMTGALAVVMVIGVCVLWGFYGFRYAARPPGLALAPSLKEYVGPLAGMEARAILVAARLHILPESWLYGLADVRAMANGMPSYFFGKVYAHGVWFYFPVLFTIKSTLGMLGLLGLTAFAVERGWLRRRRELWFLIAPPSLYMVVAMGSHLNIGARHILPVWVFCCVLAAGGAMCLARRRAGWAWAVGVLVVLHVGTSLRAAPNYIPYANEAWGGPTQTYRYLSDSNTDWAQQMTATSAYLRGRQVHDCWIAYFAAPFILPQDYGIPCRRLPTFDSISADDVLEVPPVIDGPVLISAGDLNGFEFGSRVLNPYEGFRTVQSAAFVQDGIFVFEGRFSVALASALAHVGRSSILLKGHELEGAVREAKVAEQISPGEVQTEMALGDALAAVGEKDEARAAFGRGLARINTMEPDARASWTATIRSKLKAL